MSKPDISKLAQSIVKGLGGKENLSQINHCATRLRVTLKDPAKADVDSVKKIGGVMGVELRGDQAQVIVGQIIEDLFLEVEKLTGKIASDGKPETKEKKTIPQLFSSFLLMMAGIMSPVIPALIAAGFLATLLTIMQVFFHVDPTNSTYVILNNFAQSVFYFLPVFVAYSSAKKFDTEPVLAMLLACALLYPDWVSMAAEGGFTSYFGLPVMLTTYNGAVIQIILSIYIMSRLDRWLKRVIPEVVRHFLKPFILLLAMSVITLTVTGPLGGLVTDYIAIGINWVRSVAPWAAVPAIILFASTVGLLCPGFHLALIPIALTSLATVGYDDLINIWFLCCTITPGFVALAIALKSKSNKCRQIAFPATLSALLGGISEPTTYGLLYKMVRPFYAYFFTAFTASILAGFLNLKCFSFGGYSLTNIMLYLGPNLDYANFRNAIIVVVYIAIASFVSTYLIGFDDSVYDEDESDAATEIKVIGADGEDSEGSGVTAGISLRMPVSGEFIPQEKIGDSTFAQGVLGACFGVKPTDTKISAPASGKIVAIAKSNHAVTMVTPEGAEILIHIGVDSVKLDGRGLEVLVKKNQTVKAGDAIAAYDKALFDAEGIDDTVVCILLNSKSYASVECKPGEVPLLATV